MHRLASHSKFVAKALKSMKAGTVAWVAGLGEPHLVSDGFRGHNFNPCRNGLKIQRMNSLMMPDYNPSCHFPSTDKPKGVGVHPLRGIETVLPAAGKPTVTLTVPELNNY